MGTLPKVFPPTEKLYRKDMVIREEWKKYIDKHGIIVQGPPHSDGGDSMQRVGMIKFGLALLNAVKGFTPYPAYPYQDDREWNKALNWLEHERYKGLWRRHWNAAKWYGVFKTHETRDQKRPIVAALGMTKSLKRLWQTFWRHLTRRGLLFAEGNRKNHQISDRLLYEREGGTTWNGDKWRWPDPTGPQFWASYVRGFINCFGRNWIGLIDAIFLYVMAFEISGVTQWIPNDLNWLIWCSPLIWLTIFDIHTLISSIQTVIRSKGHPRRVDDLNHQIDLAWGIYCHPTLTIQLARLVYLFRPIAMAPRGGFLWERKFGPQTAIDYYFRPDNFGPPMHKLWKHVIDWMYPPNHWFWGTLRKHVERVR